MLGECKKGRVMFIRTLDSPKGYWNKRCIFLNTDSPFFNKLFFDICTNNNVLLNFREVLEVNYESGEN